MAAIVYQFSPVFLFPLRVLSGMHLIMPHGHCEYGMNPEACQNPSILIDQCWYWVICQKNKKLVEREVVGEFATEKSRVFPGRDEKDEE